jgi:hypothetical protein
VLDLVRDCGRVFDLTGDWLPGCSVQIERSSELLTAGRADNSCELLCLCRRGSQTTTNKPEPPPATDSGQAATASNE